MKNELGDLDVFILCGGKGSRLSRICKNTPKPMLKIGGRPFLDIIIRHLSGFGLRRFILGVGYKAEAIESYYRKKRFSGVELIFSREANPLGTGGAVKNAWRYIKSKRFFVLNGDSFSNFDPIRMLSFHKKNRAMVSILLRKANYIRDYGSVNKDALSRITRFSEKAHSDKSLFINSGVYIFDKNVFSLFPGRGYFSLERDFFPKITQNRIFGYSTVGFFIDIGTPERFQAALQRKELKNV